jgi:serine/threonine-protein kinase RsbW
MEPVSHRFDRLGTSIDELHALFDAWAQDNPFAPSLGAYGLEVMRLAVHEWVANLVQHASFGGREGLIQLDLVPHPQRLRCFIADNSEGFDFDGQLGVQRAMVRQGYLNGLPPERGRGLMMLAAFTEGLTYTVHDTASPNDVPASLSPDFRQHVSFWIASSGAPPPLAPTDDRCRILF